MLKRGAGYGGLSRTPRERMGLSSVTGPRPTQTQMLVCYYYSPLSHVLENLLEYPFARYNAKSPDYAYSQDEYNNFLEGSGLSHLPVVHAHATCRLGMDKGRDRLPLQSHPGI